MTSDYTGEHSYPHSDYIQSFQGFYLLIFKTVQTTHNFVTKTDSREAGGGKLGYSSHGEEYFAFGHQPDMKSIRVGHVIACFLTLACSFPNPDAAAELNTSRQTPAFKDNMYAQLLMLAVSGSLLPAHSNKSNTATTAGILPRDEEEPSDAEARQSGSGGRPRVGHTMAGLQQLEKMYEAITTSWSEGIPGDLI